MAILWQLLFDRRHALDLDAWLDAHLELVLHGLEQPAADGTRAR